MAQEVFAIRFIIATFYFLANKIPMKKAGKVFGFIVERIIIKESHRYHSLTTQTEWNALLLWGTIMMMNDKRGPSLLPSV